MATGLTTETIIAEQLKPPVPDGAHSGEVSFREICALLSARKRMLAWTLLLAVSVSTAIAFLIPAEYTAQAVILTPQQAEPSLSTMVQLAGGAASLSGLSLLSGLGLRNPSDLYVGILESRTIADALIARFNLKHVYGDKYVQQARKHLSRRTNIKAGRDTLIRIEVDDRDPKRASELANAYVAELAGRNTTVALTEASQRRLFFEQQLASESKLLATAEIALRDTERVTGLVVPSGQAEALIRSASQLNTEILSREALLAGMRTYASDENPRFQAVQRELNALRSELDKLERGKQVAGTPEVPVGNLPQAGLEYVRKYRDVKYHESLYEALAKQYEAARLDEAKAAPLIQVVDKAVVPERKSWPPRLLIVLVTTALSVSGVALGIVAQGKASSRTST